MENEPLTRPSAPVSLSQAGLKVKRRSTTPRRLRLFSGIMCPHVPDTGVNVSESNVEPVMDGGETGSPFHPVDTPASVCCILKSDEMIPSLEWKCVVYAPV